MSVLSINNFLGASYFAPMQGLFNTSSSHDALIKQMNSLAEQRKNLNSKDFQSFNPSLTSDLTKIGTAAGELRAQTSAMASLNQFSSSVGKTASYSDENVLSATVSRNATVSSVTRTDVNVSQLASAQQNTGAALDAADNSFGSSFSLSITNNAGRTSNFNVDLNESANNRSAMQSMADRVNSANIGVRAAVTEDKESGTVSLQFTSTQTGSERGSFTVNDTSAADSGNVTREAANAEYSVNGANFTSQSNDVRIMSGVDATLNSTGSTQITYNPDVSGAVNSVNNFINTFNSLRDAASGSQALKAQLDSLATNYSRALGFSGIGRDSGGNLTISNEGRLSQAISDGSFSRNFQGVSSFGNRLSEVSGNAYRTAYNSAVQNSFKDLLNNMSNNNSANKWMNDLSFTSGLLFNMRI